MNRLPAFPVVYDASWGNTFTRTLETNLNELSQPISSGWNVTPNNTQRVMNPTSAVGVIGNVNVTTDRKSTRLNSSHVSESRMPSSA